MSREPSQEVAPTAADQYWRRVHCKRQTVFDQNLGRLRPTSNVFKDGTDELGAVDPVSAFRANECERPEVALAGYESEYGLVMISQSLITACNLSIVDRPDADGPPGHVVLEGRKTGSVISRLAKEAVWVVGCPEAAGTAMA